MFFLGLLTTLLSPAICSIDVVVSTELAYEIESQFL